MRLTSLSVKDLGLFRGTNRLDLSVPQPAEGRQRPLVIVRGHNGAGKSTLFQSAGLALYGARSLGDRVGAQAYSDYLLAKFHRDADGKIADAADVSLGVSYVESGEQLCLSIARRWNRRGSAAEETLSGFCDGKSLSGSNDELQARLSDLFPPSLAHLCLFDGEQLDALATPDRHAAAVGSMLHRLLGLDLVDRLVSDLALQVTRSGGAKRERWRREILAQQAELDRLEARSARLREQRDALDAERADLEADLGAAEQDLIAEGGLYAARRPILEQRVAEVRLQRKGLEDQLHELAADLLPFALAPELCLDLRARLEREAAWQRREAAREMWDERVDEALRQAADDPVWRHDVVDVEARAAFLVRLRDALRESADAGEPVTRIVHPISDGDREKMLRWISQAVRDVPHQVSGIGARLRALRDEEDRAAEELARVPDDAVLAPIHARITALASELEALRGREAELHEEIGRVEYERELHARKLEQARVEHRKVRGVERQVDLAERSRLVLRTYKDALLRQRLARLEEHLVEDFNRICRKERLLSRAEIGREDFSVTMHGVDGHRFGLASLSAGERQLYALALLQALRRVSGIDLPLVMDTPLARLDVEHRQRVIRDYIPSVASQCVLFVTDAEMSDGLLEEVAPFTSRVYRLSFDAVGQRTRIEPDPLPAYRGNGYLAGGREVVSVP